jgi:hypothetical protein
VFSKLQANRMPTADELLGKVGALMGVQGGAAAVGSTD